MQLDLKHDTPCKKVPSLIGFSSIAKLMSCVDEKGRVPTAIAPLASFLFLHCHAK